LQSGDEICIPADQRVEVLSENLKPSFSEQLNCGPGEEFRLILDSTTGACIALNEEEMNSLHKL
jgi:hypothetical protein